MKVENNDSPFFASGLVASVSGLAGPGAVPYKIDINKDMSESQLKKYIMITNLNSDTLETVPAEKVDYSKYVLNTSYDHDESLYTKDTRQTGNTDNT